MVSRAGEEALRVQGGGGGTGIRRRPWLKGGRLREDGQVQGARFSTSERDTAEPDGAGRAESARRWSGWCWAFLRSPAPCSGGSRQVPGETRLCASFLPEAAHRKAAPPHGGGGRWRKPLGPASCSLHRLALPHDLGKALPLSGPLEATRGHGGFLKQGTHWCKGRRGAGAASSGQSEVLLPSETSLPLVLPRWPQSPGGTRRSGCREARGFSTAIYWAGPGARTRAQARSAP